MNVIDHLVAFFKGQSTGQYLILKALDKLEVAFPAEDAFASVAMREAVQEVRLELQRDDKPVENEPNSDIATPAKVARKLLRVEVRKRLDGERGAIALTAKHRGLFEIEKWLKA